MKRNLTVVILLLALGSVSCIREEALNSEADIESCTLEGDVLNRDPIIENEKVTLILKKGTDLTALAPHFTLTPGATISPASGTTQDFTASRQYVVTSQDGLWKKSYKVEATTSSIATSTFRFENVRLDRNEKYQIFYETGADGAETLTWASGNSGFALTGAAAKPEGYPTYQSSIGYKGKCLALTTCKTGSFGARMNMPIAAGNLFIGTFEVLNALTDPLTATKFGMPFDYVPTHVRGFYKYKAGETFYELDPTASDKLRPVPGKKDMCNIYAVFYESTEEMKTLDGTNALSEDNPNVLAVAQLQNARETERWLPFELEFVFRAGKQVDAAKLAEGRYSLALVFTSSISGDRFEGAPGSTLCVDEVTLAYKEQPNE